LANRNRGYTDETRLPGLFYEVHAPSGLCLCSSEFYSPNRF